MTHFLSLEELEAGLAQAGPSPSDAGQVVMIVRRPEVDRREALQQAELSLEVGLAGDNWLARGSRSTPDGSAHPDAQITLMNSRVIQVLAGDTALWPLAGDQLFVDLDLSEANLPPGQRLAVGEAVLEITTKPHTGCAKFVARYGPDANRFVNSPDGRRARRRGANARVVKPGVVRLRDVVRKL